jgi:hypothetical protein
MLKSLRNWREAVIASEKKRKRNWMKARRRGMWEILGIVALV